MSQTAAVVPPRSKLAVELTIFRSTAERHETQADFLLDDRLRRERGLSPRDPHREPPRRSAGPWYDFRPFEGEESAEPYGVVEALYGATLGRDLYGGVVARVVTMPGSSADMSAAAVAAHAATGSHSALRAVSGPMLAEVSDRVAAEKAARDARLAELAAGRDAERDAVYRAREELRAATAAVRTPKLGDAPWVWFRRDVGVGYTGATTRLHPLPAVVIAVARRNPSGPPPVVGVVVLGVPLNGGTEIVLDLSYSAAPAEGSWSWPVEDFAGMPPKPLV